MPQDSHYHRIRQTGPRMLASGSRPRTFPVAHSDLPHRNRLPLPPGAISPGKVPPLFRDLPHTSFRPSPLVVPSGDFSGYLPGEGPATVWGRSAFLLGTFPTEIASHRPREPFPRGRSRLFSETFPKRAPDLPHRLLRPSPELTMVSVRDSWPFLSYSVCCFVSRQAQCSG